MTQPRSAVVTGGGSGIGRAVAQRLAAEGHKVLIVGRTASALEQTAQGHESIRTFIVDITSPDAAQQIAAAAQEYLGDVDVLVNNAGVGGFGPLEKVSTEAIEQQFRTNVFAPILITQALLPALERSMAAVVVNISSAGALGTRGWPENSVYWATKSALNSLTRSWAVELGQRKIRVVSVAPGVVRTGVGSALGWSEEQYEGFLSSVEKQVPLGVVATADDVAWWVVQAATAPGAGYANGSIFAVDGGLSLV